MSILVLNVPTVPFFFLMPQKLKGFIILYIKISFQHCVLQLNISASIICIDIKRSFYSNLRF